MRCRKARLRVSDSKSVPYKQLGFLLRKKTILMSRSDFISKEISVTVCTLKFSV